MAGLTPRQQAFIEHYCVSRNATQAAIDAGYSAKGAESMGSQLLANVKVAQAIRARFRELSERLFIEEATVLMDLWAIKERCLQRVAVLDKDGNPTGEWTFDAKSALKALELIGKHLGMFGSKVDLRGVLVEIALQIAHELGLSESDAVAEAERIVRERVS